MNPQNLLNALIGARSRPGTDQQEIPPQRGFLEEALSSFGSRSDSADGRQNPLGGLFGQGTGGIGGMLGQVFGGRSGLSSGMLGATAGLLLGSRRGLMGGVARMGGLGLIGALAYKAFRAWRSRNNGEADRAAVPAAMHPANATDADAELYLRAMVAAIASDGRMDESERARVCDGLKRAGVDEEATSWLTRQFAKPATVDELALSVRSQEQAAKVYTAARVAIDPDTENEREFLERLASTLRLDPQLKREVDKSTTEVKVDA